MYKSTFMWIYVLFFLVISMNRFISCVYLFICAFQLFKLCKNVTVWGHIVFSFFFFLIISFFLKSYLQRLLTKNIYKQKSFQYKQQSNNVKITAQVVGSIFMLEGPSTNVGNHGRPTTKNFKTTLAKTP